MMEQKFSFDINQYNSTILMIDKFLENQPKILKSFFIKTNSSFFRREKQDHINLTSTSTCINSLKRTNKLEEFEGFDKKILLEEIFNLKEWSSTGLKPDNAYTISLLLPGIRALLDKNWKSGLNDNQVDLINKCLKKLKSILMRTITDKNIWDLGGIFIENYPPNAFLTYWTLKSLEAFEELKIQELKQTYQWVLFHFYEEITNSNSQAYEIFDVYQLAYCLIIIIKFFNYPIPKNTVRHALEIIFQNQNKIGRWDKKFPLFNYLEAGDAYCHDFEMLRSLLEELRIEYFDIIIEFLNPLNKTLEWVNDAYKEEHSTGTFGWSSGHDPRWPYPESWATAAILDFLFEFKQILQQQAQNSILKEFGYYEGILSNVKTFDQILDSRILNKGRFEYLIKDHLKKYFNKDLPKHELAKGIILCGPPGTGKTSIAKTIAKSIDWKFILISAGKFIEKNLWVIGETTRNIFEKISLLNKVVILFDELDELVRQREPSTEMLGRFLTTTMLPYFQKIASYKKIIFIITTNRIKDFDLAIVRLGRFDLVLNVDQPARSEIKKEFKSILSKNNVDEECISLFINFLDWECYKSHLIDVIGGDPNFLKNELEFHNKLNLNELLEEFMKIIKNYVREDRIKELKIEIDKCQERDGFIDIALPVNINDYLEKMNQLNNIFNRFTYNEIKPFIINELIPILNIKPINFEKIYKLFEVQNEDLILTKLFNDLIKKSESKEINNIEELIYWRTTNRL